MSRRSIIGLLFVAAVVTVVVVAAIPQGRAPRERWTPIAIEAAAVPLNSSDPAQAVVGPFAYAGGVVLTSPQTDRLHGLSDLEVIGTDRLMAVGDDGILLTARLVLDDSGRLVGVTDGRFELLTGLDGQPLRGKSEADSEGLALLPNGDRLVSFERDHRIWLYPAAGGPPQAVPRPTVEFSDANGGMEALAPDPDAGPDAYVVGAETTGETWNCHIFASCTRGATVDRSDGMSLVALRRLAAGRSALLLRDFAPQTGSRISLVIVRANAVEAQLDLARPLTVDNFEGVAAVVRPDGGVRLYLLSDDNGSASQRTLLLAFDWRPR